MAENIVDHYLKQDAILQDRSGAMVPDKCIKVRWDDAMIEAVDISDTYVLCTGRVIIKEVVETTIPNEYGFCRFYLIRFGKYYKIVQARILPGIEGLDTYRELLVAPCSTPYYYYY